VNEIDKMLSEPNSWASWLLNGVSVVALLAASAWFTSTILNTKEAELPPRVVNSITIEPSIVLAGKPFKAHVNVTLNRLCPYEIHWSLIRLSDGVEVLKVIEPVRQPPAAIGTQDLPVSERYIPNTMAPGDYKYVSEVYDQCANGHTYTSIRHNVAITVR
jgi:hypothetical protein